jgi:hypothetical protein
MRNGHNGGMPAPPSLPARVATPLVPRWMNASLPVF